MSAIFESNRVEYRLPTAEGANTNDVIALQADGNLAFVAPAAPGSGITVPQLFVDSTLYQLPSLSEASEGEVLTKQGTALVFAAGSGGGGLTQSAVYGEESPGVPNPIIQIPAASTGTAGQSLILTNAGELEYASGSASTTISVPYNLVVGGGTPTEDEITVHFNNVGGNISVVIESGLATAEAGNGADTQFLVSGTPPVGFSAFLPQQSGSTVRIGMVAFTDEATGDTIIGDLLINDAGTLVFFISPQGTLYTPGNSYILGFGTGSSYYGAGTYALYE